MKAKALYEYGFLVWFQSQYDYARLIFQESSEIYRQIDDATGLAFSNMFLAHSTWGLGEHDAARRLWDESRDQLLNAGELWGAGLVHSFRGRAEREAENYEQAEREYDECIKLFGAAGDDWGLGISYSHQGMIAFQKNDPAKAMSLFEQRLIRARKIGFKQSTAYSIFLLGLAAWKLGDPVRVKQNMREALAYFYDLGNQATLAEALLGLAWVAAEEGEFEQAAYLLGTVMKADETDRMRMGFEDIYFHRPIIADLQLKLEQSFRAAIERGRNATLDQVAKEILES
jgi:tetratricopeptide (TPR) repeat protein